MTILKNLFALTTAALLSLAAAHATVKTDAGLSESKAGGYETYRLQVPVEKEVATTQIRLLIPAGLKINGCVALTGSGAGCRQEWPEDQAIPAPTIDHVWKAVR